MKITPLSFKDVLLIEPEVFKDERGFFFESFNQRTFNKLIGREVKFVQDNQSRSKKNVIRGLHFQIEKPQIKLIKVISGSIFDVVVDIRLGSPTYGQWLIEELTFENGKQLFIPEGFLHGFITTEPNTEIIYKCSNFYNKLSEGCVKFNDPDLNIPWSKGNSDYIISDKDRDAVDFKDFHTPFNF